METLNFSKLVLSALLFKPTFGQGGIPSPPTGGDDPPAVFGQLQPILGQMQRTDFDFADGFAIDLFSPKARTVNVTTNPNPLSANFVTGSTGQNFRAVQQYSYVLNVNETTDDLIAKVELPYDPVALATAGLDPADTYVGKLSDDGMSWSVIEENRNVHKSENKTRIIKMTSLEGEYRLLARQDIDSSNIFVQFGQGETRTVNITGGPGVQEAEFVDGLRFSMMSPIAMRFNTDVKFLDPMPMLQGQLQPSYSYSWVVNSTALTGSFDVTNSSLNTGKSVSKAEIQFPINPAIVQRTMLSELQEPESPDREPVTKSVAELTNFLQFAILRRPVDSQNQDFEMLAQTRRASSSPMKLQIIGNKAILSGVTTLDGEYILTTKAENESTNNEGRKIVTSEARSINMNCITLVLGAGLLGLLALV